MSGTKLFCGLAVCLTHAFSGVAGATVFSSKIRPIQLSPKPTNYSRGLDLSIIQPIESMNVFTSADVQNIIPTDLDPNDQNNIGRRIINNTVSRAMNSQVLRGSSLGRTAQVVQRSMQGGFSMGSREPNSVQHEIRVAADPMQAQARVNYSGLTNAQLSYLAGESKMDFEMRNSVSALATDLVYNHVDVPGDRRDLMSLRWAW